MQKFKFAKVLKPQGIKGEIKVEFLTSDLDFARTLKSFEIDDIFFHVKSIRLDKKFGYIKTEELQDRNEAEVLRGKYLYTIRPKIENDDEYYIADLEDCCIVDKDDNIIGYIDSIERYSSTSIINIMLNGARRSFPFLKGIFLSVDIKNKKIVVDKQKLDEVIVWKLIFWLFFLKCLTHSIIVFCKERKKIIW